MQLVATLAGGTTFAFPDVCKVPPVLPFPNFGPLPESEGFAPNVFVEVAPVIVLPAEINKSTGDEPGQLKGVISGDVEGKVRYLEGSTKVFAAGMPVVYVGCRTAQNGDKPNITGTVILTAQEKVFTAP